MKIVFLCCSPTCAGAWKILESSALSVVDSKQKMSAGRLSNAAMFCSTQSVPHYFFFSLPLSQWTRGTVSLRHYLLLWAWVLRCSCRVTYSIYMYSILAGFMVDLMYFGIYLYLSVNVYRPIHISCCARAFCHGLDYK